MRIEYTAPKEVHDVIASLGRTEDARFSPDGKLLAVAAFRNNRIALFEIEIRAETPGKTVVLSAVSLLTSPDLKAPHGLDFIDNETLVVANRTGGVQLYRLPQRDHAQISQVLPMSTLARIESELLNIPGSVAVCNSDPHHCEILVCNNTGHSVTRHLIDRNTAPTVQGHAVLLSKWLNIPDGISVSANGEWFAVSNHSLHSVMLYKKTPDLQPESDPLGVLCGAHYPHGVRISTDDSYILVADAGAPFVYIYARNAAGWLGLHYPCHRLRTIDDAQFQRGRYNSQEGGPKGLDLNSANAILVTTCGTQTLAFFDFEHIKQSMPMPTFPASHCTDSDEPNALAAMDVQYELEHQRAHAEAEAAKEKLHTLLNSRSWRFTAALRRSASVLKRSS